MEGATTVSAAVSGTDKTLSFETGLLAQQSQGAVVGRIGDTEVLVTANAANGIREGIDFFPLTVDVEERMYAAGKIPGSFFRREGRPSDQAILTCRLIDRPLRPSFADGYRNETQVVVTVIGADQENPHDVLAINAASAALMLSGIPFEGPLGAVRIAWTGEGEWAPHPTYQEGDEAAFELVVAGRQLDNGDVAIMMVEAGGTEAAWELYQGGAPKVTEEAIAAGLEASKTWIRESIELQRELVAKAGTRPPLAFVPQKDYGDDVLARVTEVGTDRIDKVSTITVKAEREKATDVATAEIVAELAGEFEGREKEIKQAVRSLTKKIVRQRIASSGVRIDGRQPADIRPLSATVGLIPTAHGSGLFQRGETQVLNVTTLGMPRMDQLLDTLGVDDKKRYMHHYNMPPSANGEVGRVGSPKRREIGHGLLAERALLPVVPPVEEFPYALRLVSEVLASNGSTSMASVCASTLSLMDAGVPIKAPVAGIAMGLVKISGSEADGSDDNYIALTDILGAEDAFGDMDFKVAGTAEFVTALQLDTKIAGLPTEVLTRALTQAREARLTILDVMHEAIASPRTEVRETAPKIVSLEIPLDKIGEVIGPKGKVINTLQQETGADINVDDDGVVGTVTIGGKDGGAVAEARRRIELILDPPKAEVGAVYQGKVVNITKFGAFVNILPGRDGLVHISKLGRGKRIDRVEDVVDLGDDIEVRVDDIDPQGKVSLSLTGEGADDGGDAPAPRREPREPRERRSEAAPSPVAVADDEGDAAPVASFEESWEAEASATFGDLGPAGESGGNGASGGGPRRNPRRRR
ncbi:polyribonucleotide nucleotidyltransferase [Acidiferrimicrobium sp. IK]|uniref:polyribonucleotide nucleotidyltransferase n=1 Tax=Acidiferrimicrobium sp. IK TaxID=2871700 RepID=UPI0021CB67E3|nr:polyribonucleotide nucleotidyltransferase [Acidiferrimicrobium sp. IK]MCU4183737.1 polyribonucleotide nucleotidyltransferase [Acidiferrimicrobium sp. IK]